MRKGFLSGLFVQNWKPKLICLVFAVLVWLWVEKRYVQESPEWDLDDVRLSVPGSND